jgi:uncharacterized protein YeaO (DUF488 family)
MANLGPSEALRNSFLAQKISWREFSRRYARELRQIDSLDARNRNIKNHGQKFTLRLLQYLGRNGNLTLLCHCAEDERHCHRHLLREILSRPVK